MGAATDDQQTLACVIVEDHASVLSAIESLLVADGIEVVGRATSGAAALEMARAATAIVVIDFRLGDMTGPELASAILAEQPDARIVLYATSISPGGAAASLAAGVRAVLRKDSLKSELSNVVRIVSEGGTWIDPRLAGSGR